MKMYVLDTELKANPLYKLDHSEYKVPLLRLYVSPGPLEVRPVLNEIAHSSWFSRVAHKWQLTE